LNPINPSSYPTGAPSEVPSPAPSAYETDPHLALRKLYEATNGADWTVKTNWMVGMPCEAEWYGVTCESRDEDLASTVVKLKLTRNNLDGSLPTELGLLTDLNALWLHTNSLTGTLPSELGALTHAQTLYVSKNAMTGTIPEQVGNLNALKTLLLYGRLCRT